MVLYSNDVLFNTDLGLYFSRYHRALCGTILLDVERSYWLGERRRGWMLRVFNIHMFDGTNMMRYSGNTEIDRSRALDGTVVHFGGFGTRRWK